MHKQYLTLIIMTVVVFTTGCGDDTRNETNPTTFLENDLQPNLTLQGGSGTNFHPHWYCSEVSDATGYNPDGVCYHLWCCDLIYPEPPAYGPPSCVNWHPVGQTACDH